MVALQNSHNKGVACKIVQDKELRDVSASVGSFRLKGGRKTSKIIVRRSKEIICKHLRCGQPLAIRSHGLLWSPAFSPRAQDKELSSFAAPLRGA
jgi:hypothetical protein